jgi:hypothetical protein
MDWFNLTQDRDSDSGWALVNTIMNFCVPLNAGNFLTGTETRSLSRSLLCGVSYGHNLLFSGMMPYSLADIKILKRPSMYCLFRLV